MSFFFICVVVCYGVVISSSVSCRNRFLRILPWGFPRELAVDSSLEIVLRCTPASSSARRSTERRSTAFCNLTFHFGSSTTKNLQKNNINGWGGEGRGWEKWKTFTKNSAFATAATSSGSGHRGRGRDGEGNWKEKRRREGGGRSRPFQQCYVIYEGIWVPVVLFV